MYTNSTRRYPIAKALIALFSLLLASPALAASGTALGVKQSAALQTGTTTKVLTVGADIQIGDTVVTGPSGQVQIKFSDRTELVVGPNSSLVIGDYLLRSDNSPGNFAVKALGGTFRFVTGQAEKDRYRIATPTGTIGVRGTAVDFVVDPDQTRALLFHGAVILCNNAGQCVTLDDVCELGQYDLSESVVLGNADEITGARRSRGRSAMPNPRRRCCASSGSTMPASASTRDSCTRRPKCWCQAIPVPTRTSPSRPRTAGMSRANCSAYSLKASRPAHGSGRVESRRGSPPPLTFHQTRPRPASWSPWGSRRSGPRRVRRGR
mgnify:CR=1 FL=1